MLFPITPYQTLVVFIAIALATSVSPTLSSIDRTLKTIAEKLNRSNSGMNPSDPFDPPEEKKEEIVATGGGALVCMVIGELIGLVGGSVGDVVVGLIRAALGNQAEYESTKADREKKK